MNETMTVGRLRELLAGVDDSMPVVIPDIDTESYRTVGFLLPDNGYPYVTVLPGGVVSI